MKYTILLLVACFGSSDANTVLNFTVSGCPVPGPSGNCVGDFLGYIDVRASPTRLLPESFVAVAGAKTETTEHSTLESTAHAFTGDKTKVLSDFVGHTIELSVSHGQSLWPCSTEAGTSTGPLPFTNTTALTVSAKFVDGGPGNQFYACAITGARR